jgi:hypothetical protein
MGYGKRRRPVYEPDADRLSGITKSTAASTALEPRGVYSLESSSTVAPVVYTLVAPKAGDELYVNANLIAAATGTSEFHINSVAVFGYDASTVGQDMVTLSTRGAGFHAIARTSSEWLVVGVRGATFSTST